MEIPTIWLIISGIFFTAGIVMNVVLVYVVLQLSKSVKELEPQVNSSLKSIDQMAKQIDSLSAKLEDTVDTVGSKAKSLTKATDALPFLSNKNMGIVSTAIGAAMSIFKLYQEIDSARKATSVDKKPKNKA